MNINAGAAGWFQGVTALGAIMVAMVMPQWHERTRQRAELARHLDALAAVSTHAESLVLAAQMGLSGNSVQGYVEMGHDQRSFDYAQKALEDIVLHELPSSQLVANVIALRREVAAANAVTKLAIKYCDDRDFDWNYLVDVFPDIAARAHDAALAIRNARYFLVNSL
ncbi:hypothetical protein [Paramagnetospirillum magneticum]|nr:hypothetical protein [Paramagnetospirillum magneticum]